MAKFKMTDEEKEMLLGSVVRDINTEDAPASSHTDLTKLRLELSASIATNFEKVTAKVDRHLEVIKEGAITVQRNALHNAKHDWQVFMSEAKAEIKREQKIVLEIRSPAGVATRSQVHKNYSTLLRMVALREPVLVVGSAGTGKTTSAQHVASDLGLDFYPVSVGPTTSKGDILGFIGATGECVMPLVRKAYENGGVLLVDEFDAGSGQALLCLNMLLDGNVAGFPDRMVKRHPDFVVIASANTWGYGGTEQYQRNALDGATLNRFLKLEWEIDEKLEQSLANGNNKWYAIVLESRRYLLKVKHQAMITPRHTQKGSKLLANGFSIEETMNATVLLGLDATTQLGIRQAVGHLISK